MVREILFRGKRLEIGDWVEGSLITYPDGDCYIARHSDDPNVLDKFFVDPATVGQYTGLKDKHGKRIFEGDIVRISKTLFAVEWREAEYVFGHVAGQPWSYPYFASHAESCEVIGNIYDNPELLGNERRESNHDC